MNMHEANYHNELALNRELYNAIFTSKNAITQLYNCILTSNNSVKELSNSDFTSKNVSSRAL